MAIARIPDSGAGPEFQGPRTKLSLARIDEVRIARRAGSTIPELSRRYGVGRRTIYRYLNREDQVADLFVRVIAEANRELELGLTRSQADDVAREILRRLRYMQWSQGRLV